MPNFSYFISIQKKLMPILNKKEVVSIYRKTQLHFLFIQDEKEIFNYFILFYEFFSFQLGKSVASLYLFYQWFIPMTLYKLGYDKDDEIEKIIILLKQENMNALRNIDTMITLNDGTRYFYIQN
jgi:hypothetical protein